MARDKSVNVDTKYNSEYYGEMTASTYHIVKHFLNTFGWLFALFGTYE